MKILTAPHMERCIGCHSCSLACARLVHKKLSWENAGIRIRSAGGLSTGFYAVRCLGCADPVCVAACPTGALIRRRGGGVLLREKKCIQCGDCVAACPVEGIVQDRDGRIYVCLQCGQCVDYCPHDCLEMREARSVEPGEVIA